MIVLRSAPVVAALAVCVLVACGERGFAQRGISPDQYSNLLSRALTQLSEKAATRATPEPIEFSLNLFLAHEAWVKGVPRDALVKAVDAFKEAGVDRVDVNPGQFPFVDKDEANIAKYDAIAARAREHGLKLVLNPQYSPVHHKLGSFPQWRDTALKLYEELARRYQPHTFVVAHEPSTMASRLGGKTTPKDWAAFVRDAAKVVKGQSPKSRIGAGGLATEREYLEAFADLPEVDVLTLDIYNLRQLKTYEELARMGQAKGKRVYIAETWRPPYYRPHPGMTLDTISLKSVGNRRFEDLDSQWIRTMTSWARANGLEAITPVWIFPLFKYVDGDGDLSDPAYNRAVVEALMKGERTSTFRTVQELAR